MVLAETVQQVALEGGFSGAVRVDRGDEMLLSTAYGLAHRGFDIANTADTQFAIASGGKGFTALATVSLIADGELSLDTTARHVLGSDLPLIAEEVTVGHLLAHRSGIGDYLDEDDEDLDVNDYVMTSPVHELSTTEAFLPELDGHPTKFKAGERFSYCNGGYVVLALIVERISGVGYHDLVEERVIESARLPDTAFLRSDEPSGRMALGYLHDAGLRTNLFHLPVRGNGDGGIYTTVADMHAFWNAFTEGRIVPQEWVTEMTRPWSSDTGNDARYGLGFWLAESGPAVTLVGSDAGVSFYSSHNPASRTTWTVMSNTGKGAWPIARHVEEALETDRP